MTYVDSVSVIMAMCPCTLLHVLARTTEKFTNQWQRFPSELFLAFAVPWWTTGGVRYGSPCCPVVVGRYSSFIPKLQGLGTPEYSKCMPYHRITAQQASKVLSSVS